MADQWKHEYAESIKYNLGKWGRLSVYHHVHPYASGRAHCGPVILDINNVKSEVPSGSQYCSNCSRLFKNWGGDAAVGQGTEDKS